MGGCKLVVGDVDVLLAEGNRRHGDAIEEESLLEMLCSTVREEMKVVQMSNVGYLIISSFNILTMEIMDMYLSWCM